MDSRTTTVGTGEEEKGAARELRRIFTILKRTLSNWPLSVVIVVIGISAGVAVGVLRKPTYTSETIVIYRQGVKMTEEGAAQSLSLGVRLQEMLLARSRLEQVLDELGLYQDVKAKEGEIEAVESFRKDITFKARSTDTFSISYKGKDPALVQKVTERLAKSLIDENQRLRVEQAKTQREFLEAQKSQNEIRLNAKQRELAKFLAQHPEFALDANAQTQSGASIRGAAAAQKELPKDHTLAALERQAERDRAALDGTVPPPDTSDPQLEAAAAQARSDLASAQGDLDAKRSKFGDNYPDVIAAKNRVADAQARVKQAEDAAKAARDAGGSFDPEAGKEKLKAQLASLEAEIAKRKAALDGKDKDKDKDDKGDDSAGNDAASRVVALETEWARLSRDVSEARDQMNELERNYFRAQIEASSSLGGYSDQVVVLDPAYMPSRPNAPGKTLIVIIAFGASFMLAMLISLVKALLDNHVYEESDLSRIAPILTVVPRAGGRRWFGRG
jgi:uncharacterized protein involved in exopolysaccharide biosynthesis